MSTIPPPFVPGPAVVGKPIWTPIVLNQGVVTVGRLETNTVPLQHASISRNHLKLVCAEGKVEIEDLDSRFGTFVNGARVKKLMLKPGDTVRIGSSPPYRFNGQLLEVALDGSGMGIKLTDVMIERDGRKLIDGFNLELQPDSFVGVLGPSGAGKSLMLGTLSSTIIPSSGTIEFDDGQPVKDNLDYYRSKIGIVTQDDLVYTDLTVYENLDFAAMIRLPDLELSERAKRVNSALEAVGLLEHQAKRVGVLSGGQRKRVSVAVELLLQPRLLLLDEPTSGLDPGMQARVMEMLRGLARRGVTVVCTTHTLDTLNFFDQVIVLGLKERVANVVYHGSPTDLLPAFGVHTQADLFDKLQQFSGVAPAERDQQEQQQAEEQSTVTRRRRTAAMRVPKTEPDAKRLWQQAKVVFTRAYLGLTRDKVALTMAMAQPPILGLAVAVSQGNHPKPLPMLFFTVVCALWMGMTLTVREIVRERKLYIRDRLAGMHPDAYLLGKLVFSGAVVAAQCALLWFVVRLVGTTILNPAPSVGDRLGDTSIIVGYFILVMAGLGAAMLGLLVSTMAKSERAAVSYLPLILLLQVVLSRTVTGEVRKDWQDPSAYNAILHVIEGKDTSGVSQAELSTIKQQKEMNAQLKIFGQPEMPVMEPRREAGGMSRAMQLLLSIPMVSRPSSAAIDMLSAKEATAGMVWVELFYLIVVVGSYGGVLYWQFRKLEKGWNDIRSA